jgi:hypothetical protein
MVWAWVGEWAFGVGGEFMWFRGSETILQKTEYEMLDYED